MLYPTEVCNRVVHFPFFQAIESLCGYTMESVTHIHFYCYCPLDGNYFLQTVAHLSTMLA